MAPCERPPCLALHCSIQVVRNHEPAAFITCAAAQRERDSTIATAGGGGVRVSSAHVGVLRAARELREEVADELEEDL